MKMLPSITSFIIALCLSTTALSQNNIQSISEEDKKEIIQEVIKYFKENPKELAESIVNWKKNAEAELNEVVLQPPTSGNLNGNITIFEFPDYACAECNTVSNLLDQMIIENPNIGVVHHDLPKSGRPAAQAAMEAIALYNIGKDWKKYRDELIKEGVSPETRLKALSSINVKPLDLDTVHAIKTIRKNNEIAKMSGLQNQPAIVIAVDNKVQALSGKDVTKEKILESINILNNSNKAQ